MRKITLILTLLAFSAFAFAQSQIKAVQMDQALSIGDAHSMQYKAMENSESKASVWKVTFEESTPVWTIGHNSGTKDWFVGGEADIPPLWQTPTGWYFYPLGFDSETGMEIGGKWAMLDILSNYFNGTQENGEYWIRFNNINLSAVPNPKLSFYQRFRPLNGVKSYIDISVDGGNTWVTREPNQGIGGGEYGALKKEIIISDIAGGQANVSIRFRWVTTITTPTAPYGYGWQLDDIRISNTPDHDFQFVKGHMNFFQYSDYTQPGEETKFHYSGHYGQIGNEQFDSEYAAMWFNGIVENKGVLAAKPTFNVKVLDPEGTEIFNESVEGPIVPSGAVDTLDLIEVDFLIDNPIFGEYSVLYEVSENGAEDANINDNTSTTKFRVSDNLWAKDLSNITQRVGPGNWLSGGKDGDQLGTYYLFLYEPEITDIQVFISDISTPGTTVIGHILAIDESSEEFEVIASSAMHDITEDDLGAWVTLPLVDIATPTIGTGYAGVSVIAAIEFYYYDEENNDLFIGSDKSAPTSFWSAVWYFTAGDNAGQWFSITNWAPSNLAIRVLTNETTNETVALFSSNKTTIIEGEDVKFFDISVGATSWQWTFEGGQPATSIEQNPIVNYATPGVYDVTLTVTGPNGTDTKTVADYITVNPDLSKISGATADAIKVYPNPATDIINVEVQNLQGLKVYNTVGQVVFEGNTNTIDVSNWTNGWYVLEVKTLDNVIRKNIIVQ